MIACSMNPSAHCCCLNTRESSKQTKADRTFGLVTVRYRQWWCVLTSCCTPTRSRPVPLQSSLELLRFVISGRVCERRLSLILSKGNEIKSIYIAPFICYVYLKALRHGSHSFTCKYTSVMRRERRRRGRCSVYQCLSDCRHLMQHGSLDLTCTDELMTDFCLSWFCVFKQVKSTERDSMRWLEYRHLSKHHHNNNISRLIAV